MLVGIINDTIPPSGRASISDVIVPYVSGSGTGNSASSSRDALDIDAWCQY